MMDDERRQRNLKKITGYDDNRGIAKRYEELEDRVDKKKDALMNIYKVFAHIFTWLFNICLIVVLVIAVRDLALDWILAIAVMIMINNVNIINKIKNNKMNKGANSNERASDEQVD